MNEWRAGSGRLDPQLAGTGYMIASFARPPLLAQSQTVTVSLSLASNQERGRIKRLKSMKNVITYEG